MKAQLWDGRVYEFPLSEKDMFEVLTSFKGIVLHMANKLTSDQTSIPVQDLAQEGWLGMWKAAKNWDGTGTLDGWMKQNAYWSMLTKVSRRKQEETQVDFMDDHEPLTVSPQLTVADDIESVLTAYHSGEVQAALEVLTPTQREFVIRKFWMGQNTAELKVALKTTNPYSLWNGTYGAKARLTRKLAHLVEV